MQLLLVAVLLLAPVQLLGVLAPIQLVLALVEQLQRLVCQYFADMYVSPVLIMKVYRPSASGKLACFAILYTRGEGGGVPCRAWDLGAQGVKDATKRAVRLGAPGIAGQDALGGVPAAMWVRHACAPVPAFEGSMQMEMHYDDPPVCSSRRSQMAEKLLGLR